MHGLDLYYSGKGIIMSTYGTLLVENIDTSGNEKLAYLMERVKTMGSLQSSSEYVVYADHSDYCVGFFDNG